MPEDKTPVGFLQGEAVALDGLQFEPEGGVGVIGPDLLARPVISLDRLKNDRAIRGEAVMQELVWCCGAVLVRDKQLLRGITREQDGAHGLFAIGKVPKVERALDGHVAVKLLVEFGEAQFGGLREAGKGQAQVTYLVRSGGLREASRPVAQDLVTKSHDRVVLRGPEDHLQLQPRLTGHVADVREFLASIRKLPGCAERPHGLECHRDIAPVQAEDRGGNLMTPADASGGVIPQDRGAGMERDRCESGIHGGKVRDLRV
jgi:hypothetical protein